MFADPLKNLKMLGLRETDIVADLGAGTGFYSVVAGQIVTRGKVYAVEVQKDYLTVIKNKVKEANLNNVEIIWGNIEKLGGTKIGDGIVDAVIASNVLSQVEDKEKFILETKRILKQKGKVLLIDWMESFIIDTKIIISPQKAREIFEKKGFVWQRGINVGDHHYGIIFSKL